MVVTAQPGLHCPDALLLMGYIAVRQLIKHALHSIAIPTGWWNPSAGLLTQANIQVIITRQQSPDTASSTARRPYHSDPPRPDGRSHGRTHASP